MTSHRVPSIRFIIMQSEAKSSKVEIKKSDLQIFLDFLMSVKWLV
ncbi:17079_t:CDS:1, partial [Dentiscutata heterogama]